MADEIEEIEYGVKVNWNDFKQGIGVATQAIHKFFADLSDAMMKDGKSADEILARIKSHLVNFRDSGALLGKMGIDTNAMSPEAFEKFFKQSNAAYNRELGQQYKRYYSGAFSPKPQPDNNPVDDFKKAWDAAAMSVVRFRMTFRELERPFQQVYHFVGQLRQANLQFALLSQQANTTAAHLVSSGGAFAALGGNIANFARFRSSFEMEMEKRNIGMGNGGQFTQALARYGIQYDPNSFESTMRNIVAFMSDPSKNDRQKLMAGQMLGMDQGMIAAAKRGNAFYDDYTRAMRGLSTNQTEASKRAEDLSLETHKLFTAFQNLKNAIFIDLEPIVERVVKVITPVVEGFSKLPQPLRYVIEGLVAFVLGLKTLGVAKLFLQTGKGVLGAVTSLGLGTLSRGGSEALISKISSEVSKQAAKAAAEAATHAAGKVAGNAAGKVAAEVAGGAGGAVVAQGTRRVLSQSAVRKAAQMGGSAAGSLGGTAAKAGGLAMLGPWGAVLGVLDVVSGVTNTVMGGIQRHNTNVRLDSIYNLLLQRIPKDFNLYLGSARPEKAASITRNINVSSINLKIEYLGESKEELAGIMMDKLKGELQTLV